MNSILITINPNIKELLPATYDILASSQLAVHAFVRQVVLTGSRGLAGGYRENSDIDLSLIVEGNTLRNADNEEEALKEVVDTTLRSWKSSVELDTAAVFDLSGCGLSCFGQGTFEGGTCNGSGLDCFGLYKLQKGFSGYVPKIGVDIRKAYPMITVWKR